MFFSHWICESAKTPWSVVAQWPKFCLSTWVWSSTRHLDQIKCGNPRAVLKRWLAHLRRDHNDKMCWYRAIPVFWQQLSSLSVHCFPGWSLYHGGLCEELCLTCVWWRDDRLRWASKDPWSTFGRRNVECVCVCWRDGRRFSSCLRIAEGSRLCLQSGVDRSSCVFSQWTPARVLVNACS